MAADQDKLVLGYRWVAERGKEACERCAALDGQEFYYHPGPGQRSVDGAPEPPLHPNCRCRKEAITDSAAALARSLHDPEGSPAAHQEEKPGVPASIGSTDDLHGGVIIFGVVFANNGRRYSDGPAYGYYGGGNWSHGINITGMDKKSSQKLPSRKPLDIMDEQFMVHDNDYFDALEKCNQPDADWWDRSQCRYEEEIVADRKLLEKLDGLANNPKNMAELLTNKTSGQREYAQRYLRYARWYFGGRLAQYSLSKEPYMP